MRSAWTAGEEMAAGTRNEAGDPRIFEFSALRGSLGRPRRGSGLVWRAKVSKRQRNIREMALDFATLFRAADVKWGRSTVMVRI
jgi:hypothetical protein